MKHVISCYNLRHGRAYAQRLVDVQPGDCVYVTPRSNDLLIQGLDVRDMAVHKVEGHPLPPFSFLAILNRCRARGIEIKELLERGYSWPKRP